MGKGQPFQKNAGKTAFHVQKAKLDPYFASYAKINWKWVNSLNIRTKTIKLLREDTGQKTS